MMVRRNKDDGWCRVAAVACRGEPSLDEGEVAWCGGGVTAWKRDATSGDARSSWLKVNDETNGRDGVMEMDNGDGVMEMG